MKKILVLNGKSYYRAVASFGDYSNDIQEFIKNPTNFSFVLFTGGADISPTLYNEESPFSVCGPCIYERDMMEVEVFNFALKHNVKMVGICRGIQLLTALSGGRLIHHVSGHAGHDHVMHLSHPWKNKTAIMVNSLHHQMCIPPEGSQILGWAPKKITEMYIGNNDEEEIWDGLDTEAVYIPQTNSFGVQWHPEMLSKDEPAFHWFRAAVDNFLHKDKQLPVYKKVNYAL